MPGKLEFGLSFGRDGAAPAPRDEDDPLRLLILADLSGLGFGAAPATGSDRPVLRVDIDSFERVMARIGPTIRVPAAEGTEASSLTLSSLDDFHPDHLVSRVALFGALQQTRAELIDPEGFPAAAARLADLAAPAPGAPKAGQSDAADTDASPLEQLLGGRPAGKTASAAQRAAGGIERLISESIAPHITPGPDPRQDDYVASVDSAIEEQMRALLRNRGLREMESNWRALWWLVSNSEPDQVHISVMDIDRAALTAEFAAGQAAPDSALGRQLVDARRVGESPWSMIFGFYNFGAEDEDAIVLGGLGDLAHRLDTTFVAGASPAALGCSRWSECADPAALERPEHPPGEAWRNFRRGAAARAVGLAGPGILLRLPYGPDTDEIDAFAFSELAAPDDTEGLLWGSAACAVALIVAGSIDGSPADLTLDDLPAYAYRVDGESRLTPCARVFLGERAAESMLSAGVMPLVSHRNRNAVTVLRLQTVAEPPCGLAMSS